jgi:hypothetical protein
MSLLINIDSKSESDVYELIVKTLKSPTQETVDKAQQIYEVALEGCVWSSPMGDMGCSFHTYEKSEENYGVAAKRAIEAARKSLTK